MPPKKKTGPQSHAAKMRVSRNAISHGLSSNLPVVNAFESAAEWEYHREAIIESLDPEGYLEVSLAEQVAVLMWRMRRVVHHETQLIGWQNYFGDKLVIEASKTIAQQHNVPVDKIPFEDLTIKTWTENILPRGEDLDRIKRYEAHLHRLWVQTLHELEAMQARRRGKETPLARLDITGREDA